MKQCFVESADDRLCWYRVSEGVPKQVVGHLVPRPRYGALNVTADQFLKTVLKIKVTIAVQGIGCSRQPAARHGREDIGLRQQADPVQLFHDGRTEDRRAAPASGKGEPDEPAIGQFLLSQL